MSDEAVLLVETELPIPFTCADGTGIAKGAILKLTDLNTVALADGANDIVGGIAGSEKIADDGMVRIDVYRGGIFKVVASGSITVGDSLGTEDDLVANAVISNRATATLSGSKSLGIALETATDGESFRMELRPAVINSTK